MTPEQLKASILQRAMEGKLVPQNPNDEPASELLKRIKAEKEKLISEGKIKRDKKETEIFRGDDGKHYENIPLKWRISNIKGVINLYTGNSINTVQKQKLFTDVEGINYIATKDISFNGKINYNNGVKIPNIHLEKFKIAKSKSILLCLEGGSAGRKIGFLEQDICFGNKLCNLNFYLGDNKFLYYFLQSPIFLKDFNLNKSGIIGGVSIKNLGNIPIPILPINEQQRIVEAIESALEKVDEYAESYNRLEQLDKEFPDKLKKSILQYAMQGKLVEQDPNDESVEVLLEKIRAEKQKLFEEGKIKKKDLEESIVCQGDDNSYYEEVPNTWQLLKLKNLLQLDNGTKQQNERLIYWDAKTLRGIKDAEFKEKGNKVHSKDTVILVDGENSGELFIIPHDGYMGSTFKKIHYLEAGSKKYIDLYIDSKKELLKNSKTGSAIPHLNKTLFKELIVAFPPIQEQKRISSKITQIFSQINRLI